MFQFVQGWLLERAFLTNRVLANNTVGVRTLQHNTVTCPKCQGIRILVFRPSFPVIVEGEMLQPETIVVGQSWDGIFTLCIAAWANGNAGSQKPSEHSMERKQTIDPQQTAKKLEPFRACSDQLKPLLSKD